MICLFFLIQRSMSCKTKDFYVFFVKLLAIMAVLCYNKCIAVRELPYSAAGGGHGMRHYMTAYENYLKEFLKEPRQEELSALRKETLVQLGFMQHERLVHFLVCMLVGLAFFIVLGLALYFRTVGLFLLDLMLLGLLVPYLLHYYFLENTTWRIYILCNQLAALEDGITYPNTDLNGKI